MKAKTTISMLSNTVDECNGDFSVRREKALVHSGKERPARELDRSTR
jgi:hypothetical protein